MAYGITVINATGQTQIDGTYRNLKRIETGNEAVAQGYDYVTTTMSGSLDGNEFPLIALKASATYYHSMGLLVRHGGGYYNDEFQVLSEAAHTVYYLGFAQGTFSAENYGIEVYSAAGDMVFDATMDWMKILSVNTGSLAYGNGANHTVIDADNNYFILTNPCWDLRSNGASPGGTSGRGFKRTGSTTIRVDGFRYADQVPDDSTSTDWENTYQLIEIKAP